MKIDDIDLLILSELQQDSRLSIRELAKRINLSAPSVSERVKKLEESGIIEGYTIKINHKQLGFTVQCVLEVTMKNGEYERFKSFVASHTNCDFCYRIAGQACFLVKLSVRSLEEIEQFINEVSVMARTTTHILFSEVPLQEDIRQRIEK